jgi:hypothetical protein
LWLLELNLIGALEIWGTMERPQPRARINQVTGEGPTRRGTDSFSCLPGLRSDRFPLVGVTEILRSCTQGGFCLAALTLRNVKH